MLSIAELKMDKVQKVVGRGKIIKSIQVLNGWRNWTLRFLWFDRDFSFRRTTSTRRLILKVPAHLFSCTLIQKILQSLYLTLDHITGWNNFLRRSREWLCLFTDQSLVEI